MRKEIVRDGINELEDHLLNTIHKYVSKLDKPYSLLLSGGFDSGFLAAVTHPTKAYRVKIPFGPSFDESAYASAISQHLHLPLEEIILTPEEFKANFDEAIKTLGEVTSHFSLVPLFILMRNLKEKGETDVLSGEGPDEFLGGYARYIVFDELRKMKEIPELKAYGPTIKKVLGFDDLELRYAQMMGYPLLNNLGESSFLGRLGRYDMTDGRIERMEQKFAEHFGIKLHYPYIDSDLAEYCYKLPDSMKVNNGVTKWAFRQICKKYLPKIMWNRTKMGGPVAPVNRIMGWDLPDLDKSMYIKYQEDVLNRQ